MKRFFLVLAALLLPAWGYADAPLATKAKPGAESPQQEVQPLRLLQKQGDTIYVKVKSAPIKEGTSLRDPVVEEVTKGTPLKVLEKAGTRFRVRTPGGKEGYISSLQITEVKPRKDEKDLAGFIKGDVGAGEREGVASIRGLTPEEALQQSGEMIDAAAFSDARKMDSYYNEISEKEVTAFINEGGLVEP